MFRTYLWLDGEGFDPVAFQSAAGGTVEKRYRMNQGAKEVTGTYWKSPDRRDLTVDNLDNELPVRRQGNIMTVKRMDNVGIVVKDIDGAIEFFTELGLELEGRAPIEGDWADGVTGLRDMRVEIAMMRTPDGHSRLEISRFLAPPVVADHRSAPVNALGYLRVMFTVENIDDTLARLGKRGAELVGEVVQYEDSYRLCYIRGPEGILIGLAQELGQQTSQ